MIRTCKWCGRQYDTSQASSGGVNHPNWYCSKRCESRGEPEHQKEIQRQQESTEKLFQFIGGGNAKVGMIILFAFLGIVFWLSNKNGAENAEETQEAVNTQTNIVSTSTENSETTYFSETECFEELPVEGSSLEQGQSQDQESSQFDLMIEDEITDASVPEIFEEELVEEQFEVAEEDFSNQKVYDIVEEMPSFPGGNQEMFNLINENIKYPQNALESGIEGRVFVNFIVEPNGSISNVKVLRGIGSGCDEEAMRVVKSLPRFNPGKRNDKAVRVSFTIPITFKLL